MRQSNNTVYIKKIWQERCPISADFVKYIEGNRQGARANWSWNCWLGGGTIFFYSPFSAGEVPPESEDPWWSQTFLGRLLLWCHKSTCRSLRCLCRWPSLSRLFSPLVSLQESQTRTNLWRKRQLTRSVVVIALIHSLCLCCYLSTLWENVLVSLNLPEV